MREVWIHYFIVDLFLETESKKSVQFNSAVEVKVLEREAPEIDEGKMDDLLHLLHEADPTGQRTDPPALQEHEGNVLFPK